MKCYNTLSAVVVYIEGKGRCRVATEITIKLGPVVVATRTVGGRYSQQDALTEFKRNPSLFKKDWGYEAAKSLKLCA